MGGTVNKILSTASAYVHRQDDLETIDNFLVLMQMEQDSDKPIRTEDELATIGFDIRISDKDKFMWESLVEVVYKQIDALQQTAADLQAQVSKLSAECEALERNQDNLKQRHKSLTSSVAAEYKAKIGSQQQLLEELRQVKRQEAAFTRSSR
jgi:predicted RNase H-like nuclease (RuvC/YqgF family)